jgi:putative flippase GtrA
VQRLLSSSILKYGVVGVIGTLLHTGILTLLAEWFGVHPVWASVTGFLVTAVVSYMLNKRWTFGLGAGVEPDRLVKYLTVSVAGLGINMLVMYTTVEIAQLHYLAGQGLVILVVPAFNYVLNRFWTFRLHTVQSD